MRHIVLAVHHDHPTEGPFDARKKTLDTELLVEILTYC